ncbi:MAG: tetratricopeptide repeat protein [Candidatus Acidiferrales bacterium]
MKRPGSIFMSCLACVLFIFIASTSRAQMTNRTNSNTTRRVSIDGAIRMEDNSAVPKSLRLDLNATTGGVVATAFADDSGRFSFASVLPGIYLIQVEEPGYEPIRESIDASIGSFHGVSLELKKVLARGNTETSATISVHELALPQKARDALKEGRKKLYESGQPQASIALLQKAIQAAPECYEAYYDLGIAYWQIKQVDDALSALRKSSELSSNKYGHANMALGMILADQKKYDDAERALLLSVQAEPGSWMSQFQLGRVYYNENRLKDAEAPLEKARDLKPNSPGIYRVLAMVHLRLHNSPAALEDLNAYIKLDPDSATGQQAKRMRDEVQQSLAQAQPPTAATGPPKP